MRITKGGIAVVEGDMLLSRYVEEAGKLDVDPLMDIIRGYIPNGGVVADVGACIGDHTVAYSDIVGPHGRVYAFEPNPIAFECLLYNTKGRANVVACGWGLGSVNGNVSVHVDSYNIGASRLIPYDPIGIHSTVLRLDDVAKEWARLDFMKIDAEGYEPMVLDGGTETLHRLHPILMIEINTEMLGHRSFTPQDVYDRLESLRYRFHPVLLQSYDLVCI